MPTASATIPMGRAAMAKPEKLSISRLWTLPWYSTGVDVSNRELFRAWKTLEVAPTTAITARAA